MGHCRRRRQRDAKPHASAYPRNFNNKKLKRTNKLICAQTASHTRVIRQLPKFILIAVAFEFYERFWFFFLFRVKDH